jgi:hypothetical protein
MQIGKNHNNFSTNENSLFPNTTKYSYNEDLYSTKIISNQNNNYNLINGKSTGINNINSNPSQNSILNDYNNLSKKLFSKSKFQGNASYNLTGAENNSIGNNINNNSNSQSNKNTKENFSINKITNKVNNSNISSLNFNIANNSQNKNFNTNISNTINRNGNASPLKNDSIIQKINQGTGKSLELNFNQINSNIKNSRNKSNNHNYNTTNISNTNQTTIKNNMSNVYSSNFIDTNNNNIICRNANNKINFENTMKFSGTIQENNSSNNYIGSNNIQKINKTKLDNTLNLAQGNLNRNANSKTRFNYESLLNNKKKLTSHINDPAKSKSPSIFNQNLIDGLNLYSFNILNTDSDLNADQNNQSNKQNQKSKSINFIGKNQSKIFFKKINKIKKKFLINK